MKNIHHKAQLIVSLDFELFWGMQDGHSLESYQDHVLGGRKAIPQLLKLFEKYGIHATWATVGLMFAENREEAQRYFPEEDLVPHYRNAKLSSYRLFADPAFPTGHEDCFFAPDLIHLVSEARDRKSAATPIPLIIAGRRGRPRSSFPRILMLRSGSRQIRAMRCNPLCFPAIRRSLPMKKSLHPKALWPIGMRSRTGFTSESAITHCFGLFA